MKRKLLFGIPLSIIWIFGLVFLANNYYTWATIPVIVISLVVATIGWFYILKGAIR